MLAHGQSAWLRHRAGSRGSQQLESPTTTVTGIAPFPVICSLRTGVGADLPTRDRDRFGESVSRPKRPLVGSKNGRHWQRGDARFALRSTQLSCVDRRPNVNQLAPIIQVLDPIISARTSPIRIPVEFNTKQIVPTGSSADETIRAISSAEKYRGCTFTFRSKDKSESATSGTL
jgi:hypothetical protein